MKLIQYICAVWVTHTCTAEMNELSPDPFLAREQFATLLRRFVVTHARELERDRRFSVYRHLQWFHPDNRTAVTWYTIYSYDDSRRFKSSMTQKGKTLPIDDSRVGMRSLFFRYPTRKIFETAKVESSLHSKNCKTDYIQ